MFDGPAAIIIDNAAGLFGRFLSGGESGAVLIGGSSSYCDSDLDAEIHSSIGGN